MELNTDASCTFRLAAETVFRRRSGALRQTPFQRNASLHLVPRSPHIRYVYCRFVAVSLPIQVLWNYTILTLCLAYVYPKIPLCSSRHVSTRHDTFDVSSASRRACRAVLFDKLGIAKMHGRDELSGIWAYHSCIWRNHCNKVEYRGTTSGRIIPASVYVRSALFLCMLIETWETETRFLAV